MPRIACRGHPPSPLQVPGDAAMRMISSHSTLARTMRTAVIGISMLFLGACAVLDDDDPAPEPDLSALAHQAARHIMASDPDMTRYSPMIAATFVNIDDLGESSTFGRISSEIIASGLANQGMRVREVKMGDSLFIEENLGELILSRQVQRLSAEHDVHSILMGTYAEGRDFLYVSARLVGTEDAVVLGTADFRLPVDNHLRSLLGVGR
mgnify:CR=1 FL=1